MPVDVFEWCVGIENFYKCMYLLIKVKCSSPYDLDSRKILTIFFTVISVKSSPGSSKKHRALTLFLFRNRC